MIAHSKLHLYIQRNYASQELNINTTGINPAYMKLPTHNIPGHETIYLECEYDESKRDTLFEKLKCSASDAIKIQLHDDQTGISNMAYSVRLICLFIIRNLAPIISLTTNWDIFIIASWTKILLFIN